MGKLIYNLIWALVTIQAWGVVLKNNLRNKTAMQVI